MTLPDSNIVSTDWLKQHYKKSNVVILDATLKKKPNGELIAPAELSITSSLEFNFDTEICDQKSHLPHMLPSAEHFEKAVKQLGINQNSIVVCYDRMGIFSSPRAWWMFKIFGHENVFILNGGLPKWIAEGLDCQTEFSSNKSEGNFIARFNPEMIKSMSQVEQVTKQTTIQIIDARSQGRFDGTEPEPRKNLNSGHIPNSQCLPFDQLIANGEFKDKQKLAEIFQSKIFSQTEEIIFTCGSGVTASVLALVADEVGYKNIAVYDGSWAEWASVNH